MSMATIPCSVIEYTHDSRDIEENFVLIYARGNDYSLSALLVLGVVGRAIRRGRLLQVIQLSSPTQNLVIKYLGTPNLGKITSLSILIEVL